MTGQACSPHRAADPKKEWKRRGGAEISTSLDDLSDDSLSPDRERRKRRRQICSSTVTSATETEMSSDATLVCSMLEVAASLDRLTTSAGESSDTFRRCIQDSTRKARATAVELAKRVDTATAVAALERENAQLRERLLKAEREIEKLKFRHYGTERKEGGNHTKPPLAAPKALPRARVGKTVDTSAMEIRALAEQFQALGETELVPLGTERRMDHDQTARSVQAHSVMAVPPEAFGGRTSEQEKPAHKSEQERHSAQSQGSAVPNIVGPATTWAEVVSRKKKAAKRKADEAPSRMDTAPLGRQERDDRPTPKGMRSGVKPIVNPPRRAAVAITLAPGSNKTCEEVPAAARAKIRLSEIGGPVARIRQTTAGGILFEIPGQDRSAKADHLAAKLIEVFAKEEEVHISRPHKRAEIRIKELDMAIQSEEVQQAVAAAGSCSLEEVKVGEIRKKSPRGMGTAWVQCPDPAAKVHVDKGRIVIGWVSARIEALKTRPMTCYRCLRTGHVAGSCTSTKDRSSNSYNCGGIGPRAKVCTPPRPKCPVCSDAAKASNHRLGGGACKLPGAH